MVKYRDQGRAEDVDGERRHSIKKITKMTRKLQKIEFDDEVSNFEAEKAHFLADSGVEMVEANLVIKSLSNQHNGDFPSPFDAGLSMVEKKPAHVSSQWYFRDIKKRSKGRGYRQLLKKLSNNSPFANRKSNKFN